MEIQTGNLNNSVHFLLEKSISFSAQSATQTRHRATLTMILAGKVRLETQSQGGGNRESKALWASWQCSVLGSHSPPQTLFEVSMTWAQGIRSSEDCYSNQVRETINEGAKSRAGYGTWTP